jgi:hypothetical protein
MDGDKNLEKFDRAVEGISPIHPDVENNGGFFIIPQEFEDFPPVPPNARRVYGEKNIDIEEFKEKLKDPHFIDELDQKRKFDYMLDELEKTAKRIKPTCESNGN